MLWNVRSKVDGGDGPWWGAPVGRQSEAYYMTLRVHYEMGALEAWEYMKRNGQALSLDRAPGFMGLLKQAINPVN